MRLLDGMMRRGRLVGVVLVSLVVKMAMAGEEGPSDASVSMAATLIGGISFIMMLYYFTNWPDEDIQEKSYDTISSTISIFCAVLLFSAINDMTEAYIITPVFGEGDATKGALLVDMIHMLLWFIVMQVSLAWCSGAAGPWAEDMEKFEALPESEQEEVKEAKEVNMKCYSVLLAHITGFASINAFGTVQAVYFHETPAKAVMAVPTAFAFMYTLQLFTDYIRETISMSDDGVKDEFENMWDEETEEAENDVMGLTLSFTMMSAVRFFITGCLPNQEGKEEECPVKEQLFHHSSKEKMLLLGAGVFWAFALFAVRLRWPDWAEEKELKKMPRADPAQRKIAHRTERAARTLEGLFVAIAMCFSWALFFGTQMLLASFQVFIGQDELLSVSLAMVISVTMMFGLLPLDKLADADWTGPRTDRAIRSLMDAMGLLIGFSWEQCFDTSVDALAEKTEELHSDAINPHTTKLFLSIFCACLLVPAWKWYILPFMVAKGWRIGQVLKVEDLERAAKKLIVEEEEEEDEEEEGGGEEEEGGMGNVNEKKLMKMIEIMKGIHFEGSNALKKKGAIPELPDLGGQYAALPGDENEELRKKNQLLIEELAKAKTASIRAQQMLDKTMEAMTMCMKRMDTSVGRIEQTA